MNLLTMMQKIATMESALGSCAIEGNAFADKHLKAVEDMSLEEKYIYLSKVFNELENKYGGR